MNKTADAQPPLSPTLLQYKFPYEYKPLKYEGKRYYVEPASGVAFEREENDIGPFAGKVKVKEGKKYLKKTSSEEKARKKHPDVFKDVEYVPPAEYFLPKVKKISSDT